MTAQPDTIAKLKQLAADYAAHEAAAKPHAEAMAEIKEEVRALLGTRLGSHEAGNLTVTVSPNQRADEDKFRETYPPEQFPGLYKQVPDWDAVPKKTKETFYRPVGSPKVTIK